MRSLYKKPIGAKCNRWGVPSANVFSILCTLLGFDCRFPKTTRQGILRFKLQLTEGSVDRGIRASSGFLAGGGNYGGGGSRPGTLQIAGQGNRFLASLWARSRLEVTSALSPALRAGFRACLCGTSVSLASLARPSALPSLYAPWGVLHLSCAV